MKAVPLPEIAWGSDAKEPAMDERLVAACRDGDRDARAALFHACSDRVHSIALHYFGGDEAAAKDVVQQVFVKLFTRIGQYRGDAAFTTWLYRVVANECLQERRGRRRLRPLEDAASVPAPGASRQDVIAERSAIDRAVREAVAQLPAKLRIAVLLRHFEDMSYEDMAAALGCSAGTVASRLHRGHAALADLLEARGVGAAAVSGGAA